MTAVQGRFEEDGEQEREEDGGEVEGKATAVGKDDGGGGGGRRRLGGGWDDDGSLDHDGGRS